MAFRSDREALRARIASLERELADLRLPIGSDASLSEAVESALSAAEDSSDDDVLRARAEHLERLLASVKAYEPPRAPEPPKKVAASAPTGRALTLPILAGLVFLMLAFWAWRSLRLEEERLPGLERAGGEPAAARRVRTGRWAGSVTIPGWSSLEVGAYCTIETQGTQDPLVVEILDERLTLTCADREILRTGVADLHCRREVGSVWPTSCSTGSYGSTRVRAVFSGPGELWLEATQAEQTLRLEITGRDDSPEP